MSLPGAGLQFSATGFAFRATVVENRYDVRRWTALRTAHSFTRSACLFQWISLTSSLDKWWCVWHPGVTDLLSWLGWVFSFVLYLRYFCLFFALFLPYLRIFWLYYILFGGPGVAWWLRHWATSPKVAGSIPGGVAGDFSEAADGTMCPGVDSASKNECQETRGCEGGRCVRVTTLPPL